MVGKVWAQPVFCLMRRDLLDSLTSFLASGERKIDRWFAHENAASTLFADDVVFANANTPEELAQLESFTHSH
jgi:molybdopterin-guanine dinucleotide biosynthesis protein A